MTASDAAGLRVADPTSDPGSDPVEALRAELPAITVATVGQRVERFERANEILATALAELDEV